jgi:hypothetical protein
MMMPGHAKPCPIENRWAASTRRALRLEAPGTQAVGRVSVAARPITAIPHLFWLQVWQVVAQLAAVANWFATLWHGKSPQGLHEFIETFLRYRAHVMAYATVLTGSFPPFTGRRRSYPVEVDVDGPARQSRWTIGFRALVALPAVVLAEIISYALIPIAVIGWMPTLVLGRNPRWMRHAILELMRFQLETLGYLWLLTEQYPSLKVPPPSGDNARSGTGVDETARNVNGSTAG